MVTLQDPRKGDTRFTSTKPANEIIASIEEVAKPLGFDVQTRDFKMKMRGDKHGRKGHLSVATQVGKLQPCFMTLTWKTMSGMSVK
jgi:5'-AMP-activated protein kinase catalytic alpha subunit